MLTEDICSHSVSRSHSEFAFQASADVLLALANRQRLRILKLLCDSEWDVTSLARAINISQPSLSQHLAKLKSSGLVAGQRDSTTIRYRCISPFVKQVVDVIERDFPETRDRLSHERELKKSRMMLV
ncbi:metalloregulator ArsR/SmtB family transcription factor [Neorhizobium sp. BT27B]|uniref:ArsR/SmtB family transcription factor n=1 Tax=Neorhizobium sp. BT27B TaxID=3142625 RepID=UPI003D2B9927